MNRNKHKIANVNVMQHQRDKLQLFSLAPPLRQVEGRVIPAAPKQPDIEVNKNWKLGMRSKRRTRKLKAKIERLESQKKLVKTL